MMTYLEDSRCELSNNLSENSIRPVTVGRRNWLFCDTTDEANASMAVYSLLETILNIREVKTAVWRNHRLQFFSIYYFI